LFVGNGRELNSIGFLVLFPVGKDEAKRQLKAAGFEQLSEREEWTGLQPGGKYFFTRNHSALVGFAIGAK
jgi:aspartyl aminopeptidase